MDRERWRRVLWVVSLAAALILAHWGMIRVGVEWGIGAAP
jgi:hypothetical protein